MPLASYADANDHLDLNKAAFLDDEDARPEAEYADAIVYSHVATVFPENYLLWTTTDPLPVGREETPSLIREIAGMLMASKRYEKVFSEEQLQPSDYAERLKRDAYALLTKLVSGEMSLVDVEYEAVLDELRPEQSDFWPNDTTTNERVIPLLPEFEPQRFARMGDKF